MWLTLLASIGACLAARLSLIENARLQRTCGFAGEAYSDIADEYKIMNGRRAKRHEVPSAVMLRGESKCSGTLISPRHVLTAAHCIHRTTYCGANGTVASEMLDQNRPDYSVLRVFVGGTCPDCEEERETTMTVLPHKIMEPARFLDYACFGGGDIALIELDQDIPPHIATPACVAGAGSRLGSVFLAAGYGATGVKQKKTFTVPVNKTHSETVEVSVNTEVRHLRVANLSRQTCHEDAPRDVFCTREVETNVCHGDSGGGIVQQAWNGRQYLSGVVSNGADCTRLLYNRDEYEKDGTSGNQHTAVRAYSDWICHYSGVCSAAGARFKNGPGKLPHTLLHTVRH